jgi:hypothetical protein
MHLFSPNRAICCIIFLHGWIFLLTGVDAISDVIPVLGWLLLLTVEFMLANIWLWFRRDVAMWERITGFLTSTSLILISIQVLACFIGMGHRSAEARFYLMIVVLMVLIAVACLLVRFVVRTDLALISNSATNLQSDDAKRKVYRIVNFAIAGLLIWGVFHVEVGQGLVDYCIERLGRLDSIGDAFPLPNLVMISSVLAVGSFLTFALLNMHRWVFAGSWVVSLIAALVVCQPLWRFERMVFRSAADAFSREGDAFTILCIWLMILAIRLSGNRLRRMEFGSSLGQFDNAAETLHNRPVKKRRWWQRFNAHLRPVGNLAAVLLVMMPVYMSQSYPVFKLMWLGGQQQNVDVRVYRGGVATLRDIAGVVITNADIDPFISVDVFREIRFKNCSQLSADVLKMVTYQSHLESLSMLDVPSGLQDVALGKISEVQSLDVQGPGVTSSFLSALGDHKLKVEFNAQQGEISYDKRMSWWSGRREGKTFVPLEIALSYLQLHSDTTGFDGSEVNDWIQQVAQRQVAETASNSLAHKLHVTLELSVNQSSIFGELSKIEVANRCYLTIDDSMVSLADHQFGKLHNNTSLQLLSFENLQPLQHPQQVVLPKLRHLKLGTRLTRGWLLWAIEQPALESLSISLTGIDHNDELEILQILGEFKSLRRLQLHGKLSPAVLRTLLELDEIESWFINDSAITDTQLAAIAEMKSLKEFHVERVMSRRMLQMVISDRTLMDRFFPTGVQISDEAIFKFMDQVPNTTIYQFLSPRWLQLLVTTTGNVDSRGLEIWGGLRKQGYSLQAIAKIYTSLRIHHSDLSAVALFKGADLTGENIARLVNAKSPVEKNVMSDLNMLDEQSGSAAIVLGRGVDEGELNDNVLPKTVSFIAAGVTGQFIEKLAADSDISLFIAGQFPELGSLLSIGLQRNVQLRLQQFRENGGQHEMNSSFRMEFLSKGDPLAGQRWGPLLADTLTGNQDIRILISSLDGDSVIPTLSPELGVDVLAIPELMLTAEMLEWISSNKELKVVCLDPTLTALSEQNGNGEISFADLAVSTVASHRWDNILPLLRMENPVAIFTKFGVIGSRTVILKRSRLENILPQVLRAFPNVETIDAMQSVLTLGGMVPQVGSVKKLELQNALLEGTNEPLSSLAKQFPNVVSLQLSGATLPVWDIQGLAVLTSLRELNLTGCDIDDEALRSLEAMDSLRVLSLSRTAITNESMGVLATLTKLRQLNVYQTGMDADTVASLRTFLPRCKIYGAIGSR